MPVFPSRLDIFSSYGYPYDCVFVIFCATVAASVLIYGIRRLWGILAPPRYLRIPFYSYDKLQYEILVQYQSTKFIELDGHMYYMEDCSGTDLILRRLTRRERIVLDVIQA